MGTAFTLLGVKASKGCPDVLYHYTGINGFFGILRSQTIWATSLHCLNDTSEFRYGLKCLDAAASSLFKEDAKQGSVARRIATFITERELSSLFVASFSKHDDQLSQWRAYAPQGGYALGFRSRLLARAAFRAGFSLRPCVYDEKEQRNLFTAGLRRLQLSFERDGYELPRSAETFAVEAFSNALRLLQLAKHPSFEEEAEWRAVSRPLPSAGSHVKWRSRGPLPVPYVEIPLTIPGGTLPLAEVVVGPMPNPELAQLFVTDAVTTLCGLRGVAVRISQTPYRP